MKSCNLAGHFYIFKSPLSKLAGHSGTVLPICLKANDSNGLRVYGTGGTKRDILFCPVIRRDGTGHTPIGVSRCPVKNHLCDCTYKPYKTLHLKLQREIK